MGNNNSYRTEQLRAVDILSFFTDEKIKTEYKIQNLTIDGKPAKPAIPDIVLPYTKIAIRLQGGIHTASKKQREKDDLQCLALEESGWIVINFWEDKMPNLWTKNKYTDERKELAMEEVRSVLCKNLEV